MTTRFSYGGDEHIFAEVEEEMSLDAFFKAISITGALRDKNLAGVTEICPANASFQVKYDPDVIAPEAMLEELKALDAMAEDAPKKVTTRIIEVPVYFQDPWTHATLMRFRERHQDPTGTDLDYAARINGYDSAEAFIEAFHASPWFVSMVGFVAGLPFMYQLVEREKQLQVPKYLRPRTDTPKQTIGYGGCFSCIYSVRGAGGYQMFGITPMPIFDPTETISYLTEFMVFFRPGDIVKFKPIGREEHDRIEADVKTGAWRPRIAEVEFDLAAFNAGPADANAKLMEALDAV